MKLVRRNILQVPHPEPSTSIPASVKSIAKQLKKETFSTDKDNSALQGEQAIARIAKKVIHQ